MMQVLFALALMCAGICVIVVGGIKYSEWLLNRSVGSFHRDIEEIMNTGKPPVRWRNISRRRHFLVRDPKSLEKLSLFDAIERLTKLLKYIEHSPLIEEGDVRSSLIHTLAAIQMSWNERLDGLSEK